MKFDLKKMKQNKTVVNCKTEEQAKLLLDFLKEKGIKWASNDPSTFWHDEKEKTCYNVDGIYLSYDSNEYFLEEGYTILEFEDIIISYKPNICKILGVELGEKFNIKGIARNPCVINNYHVMDNDNEILDVKHLTRAINDPSIVEKVKEFTTEQKEIFKSLKVLGYNYIARDKDCCIYAFEKKPIKKYKYYWSSEDINSIELNSEKILKQPHLNFIIWDEEPFEIPEVN